MAIYSGFSHEKLWFSIVMLVYQRVDPENDQFIVETSLPTPMTGRVYDNLLEGNVWYTGIPSGKLIP